ncbi:DUF262 domain-containing protein [Acrocarpospora sp. B8E8]|uniref:DUF262 domain-containing protein n=1 Tax=Acrocarpospora sp. B8E8 TaxID=3153572 RepID=UPI00325E31B3
MAAVVRLQATSIRPSDLVGLARVGRIRMPVFQRSYRWDRSDVVHLFDSILRGYPIGNLLLWQRPAVAGTVVIGHLSIAAPAVGDAYWVVDGQQRITSLVGALSATEETVDPRFRIYFDLTRGEFVSLSRRTPPGIDQVPVADLISATRMNSWIQARPQLDSEQITLVYRLYTAVGVYRIPMYVVGSEDEKVVREIFERVNTFGKPLRSAEIFNALHSVSAEQRPSDLFTFAASFKTLGFGGLPESIIRQSILAVRSPDIDRDFGTAFKDDEETHQIFVDAEIALGYVVDFLRDEADIPHIELLPRIYHVPVLVRFMAQFGPPAGRTAELLRRWIWRGAILGSAESVTASVQRGARAVHTDPVASAGRLLELLPERKKGSGWQPDLSHTRINAAQAKVNILGLLSRKPRRLAMHPDKIGEPVDINELLEFGVPLAPILPPSNELSLGMANRVINPGEPTVTVDELLMSRDIDEQILFSQCMDADSVELLRRGDPSGFLQRRATIVTKVIADNVQRHALFGFRDGPGVRALFDEDEELG